jgi:hypothetical protein
VRLEHIISEFQQIESRQTGRPEPLKNFGHFYIFLKGKGFFTDTLIKKTESCRNYLQKEKLD